MFRLTEPTTFDTAGPTPMTVLNLARVLPVESAAVAGPVWNERRNYRLLAIRKIGWTR